MTPPEDPAMSDPHDPAREPRTDAGRELLADDWAFMNREAVASTILAIEDEAALPPPARADADAAWARYNDLLATAPRHSHRSFADRDACESCMAVVRAGAAIRSTGTPLALRDAREAALREDGAGFAADRMSAGDYKPTHVRDEPLPIDLDGIEMRWAAAWSESDDGIPREWHSDVAALIGEVHRLRRVSNGYPEGIPEPRSTGTPPGLDAAWAAAEAALPEGMSLALHALPRPGWAEAVASIGWEPSDDISVDAASPAAALLALAARLAATTLPSAAEAGDES